MRLADFSSASDGSDEISGQKLLYRAFEYCTDRHAKHSVLARLRYYGPGGAKTALDQGLQLNGSEDRFFAHHSAPEQLTGEKWFAYRERVANVVMSNLPGDLSELGRLASKVKSGEIKDLSGLKNVSQVPTNVRELAAVYRNQWFAGTWQSGGTPIIQNLTDRMRDNKDFAKGVKLQIDRWRMETMAMPFLTITATIANAVVFARAEQLFHARYFAFDYKDGNDTIAVWDLDRGVARVRFGAEVNNLPLELEYFVRNEELGRLVQGENPGVLLYRTATTWKEVASKKADEKVPTFAPYEIVMERLPDGRAGSYNRLEAMFEWDFQFDSNVITEETIQNKPSKETLEPNPLMQLAQHLTERLNLRDAENTTARLK